MQKIMSTREEISSAPENILQEEQRETSRELVSLLRVTQEMGRRLAYETHGDLYDDVRTLNELLHESRIKADTILNRLMPQ